MSTDPWGNVEIRGNTATITTDDGTHEIDITNPENPTIVSHTFPCPVPGCEFTTKAKAALGPHVAAHRRHGDPGTPPLSKDAARKMKSRANDDGPARKPKPKAKISPADVIDGVLSVLYPVSIPTERVREVAAWIETTERLASLALADQAEPEDPPS